MVSKYQYEIIKIWIIMFSKMNMIPIYRIKKKIDPIETENFNTKQDHGG